MDDVVTLDDGSFSWESDRAADATSEGNTECRSTGGVLWMSEETFNQRYRCYMSRDGKREIIERRDWTFLNSMIASDLETEE